MPLKAFTMGHSLTFIWKYITRHCISNWFEKDEIEFKRTCSKTCSITYEKLAVS
jgi:hypothetical protein